MASLPRMRIFVPKEIQPGETRAPIVPATAAKLAKLGAEIEIEAAIGASISRSDAEYRDAGATISTNRKASLGNAHMVLRLS
jgi:NAD(P) transhydrogenase subunit alpha